MATTAIPARLCRRFGPGRLPGAENRAIGRGYAVATAALSAAVLFVLLACGSVLLTTVSEFQFSSGNLGSFFALYGLAAIPFVVPAAFLAGAIVWRTLPEGTRYFGPVAGVLATALTYVIGLAILAVVIVGYLAVATGAAFDIVGAAGLTGLIGAVAFVSTCWLTLPLGAVSGYIHERAVAAD
jgi:hypothetical protein